MRFSLSLAYCSFLALWILSASTANAQDTNFPTGPQYLMLGSPLLARSISTPTLAIPNPSLEVGASSATAALSAGAENNTRVPTFPPPANLFPIYYGREILGDSLPSVIEISSNQSSSEPIPASILDTGVWQFTTAQSIEERGYGVTLAVAASQSRARTRHGNRVYTNADIDRLHGGS